MTLKTRMQQLASDRLTKHGEEVTCIRGETGDYTPSDMSVTDSPQIGYTGVGYPTKFQSREVDGVNILSTDTLLVFYSTTTPESGDQFRLDSQNYNVINVEKIRVQGGNVIYKVQLRL